MTKTLFGKKLLMLATITVLVTGLTLAATFNDAEAKKVKTTDVSVWDSSVPIDFSKGIFPVGGAGQVDGFFVVDTKAKKDTAIQVGLRAQERLTGPITPIGDVYIAPTGLSGGLRAWNFDFSIDSGTDFLGTQLEKDLTTLNLEDFTVILEIKDAEKNKFTLDFDLGGVSANPAGPIILVQQSWNIAFDFISIDPVEPISVDSEAYKISVTVSDDKGKKVAKSKITVLVTDEEPEDGKLNICHKEETISVKVKSVAKHIEKHGDTIGPCVTLDLCELFGDATFQDIKDWRDSNKIIGQAGKNFITLVEWIAVGGSEQQFDAIKSLILVDGFVSAPEIRNWVTANC